MPLVCSKELLLEAQKNNYAVGAFNVENMEMMQAVVAAAEAENAHLSSFPRWTALPCRATSANFI